jgi:hypothetical protein
MCLIRANWHVQLGTPLYVLKELGGLQTLEMVNRYTYLAPERLTTHSERLSVTAQLLSVVMCPRKTRLP